MSSLVLAHTSVCGSAASLPYSLESVVAKSMGETMFAPCPLPCRAATAPQEFVARLDAYLTVQGFCNGTNCYHPYDVLHPDGTISNFTQACVTNSTRHVAGQCLTVAALQCRVGRVSTLKHFFAIPPPWKSCSCARTTLCHLLHRAFFRKSAQGALCLFNTTSFPNINRLSIASYLKKQYCALKCCPLKCCPRTCWSHTAALWCRPWPPNLTPCIWPCHASSSTAAPSITTRVSERNDRGSSEGG